jgi:hypothetical protein
MSKGHIMIDGDKSLLFYIDKDGALQLNAKHLNGCILCGNPK